MGEKKDNRIVFTIEGEDYKKLSNFMSQHSKCLEKHPNMTIAQYEYSFIADSLGTLSTVTCCCGKHISFSSDFDLALETVKLKPEFQVYPEENTTAEILKRLKLIQGRPGLFFDNNGSYRDLRLYLGGIDEVLRLNSEEVFWIALEGEVYKEFRALTDVKEYSDKEMFDMFLKTVFEVAERKCPEYLYDMRV